MIRQRISNNVIIQIQDYLHFGFTIRKIAKLTKVSATTVVRVKKGELVPIKNISNYIHIKDSSEYKELLSKTNSLIIKFNDLVNINKSIEDENLKLKQENELLKKKIFNNQTDDNKMNLTTRMKKSTSFNKI